MLCIALLMEVPASHSALAAQLSPDWLARTAAALQKQLREHVAPWWPYADGAVVRVAGGETDLGAQDVPGRIVPTLPDAPSAVAYHDYQSGVPDEFEALDMCTTDDDARTALSHEGNEISADATADQWVTIPSGIALPAGLVAGKRVAKENADPLEDRSYPIDIGDGGPLQLVSDFVGPAYFDPNIAGPTSYGELMGYAPRLEPFWRTPGGYQIVSNADGSGEAEVFGKIPKHKHAKVKAGYGRLFRRGVRVRHLVP